jgi:ribosomal protein S18 acetylase RimI-like enzyme
MNEPAPPDFDIDQVVVRLAERRDLDAIWVLYQASAIDGQNRFNDSGADIVQLEEAYLSDGGESGFWVALLGDRVIGMVGVQRTDRDTAEVRRLRVGIPYRRHGVGTILMKHAMAFCQDRGYLKIILDVRVERTEAIKLFERFGFIHFRTREIDGYRTLYFIRDLYTGETRSL